MIGETIILLFRKKQIPQKDKPVSESHIRNRYDFLYFFDAKNSNPNGDPDAKNHPRIDMETSEGLVTDVCIKRKIRNFVSMTRSSDDFYKIFIEQRKPLNQKISEACLANDFEDFHNEKNTWDTQKSKKRSQSDIQILQNWLCRHYFDIRAFGAVMSTGPNAGQIRGPVQLSFARTIDPVTIAEHGITRVTDVDKEEGEMGRKFTVRYGLYKAQGFVNPFLAKDTDFSEADLELLWEALIRAHEFDASTSRPAGSINFRRLIIFKHNTLLGNAHAHQLFNRVIVHRDRTGEARSFDDYEITINPVAIPPGIEIIDKTELETLRYGASQADHKMTA